MHFTKTAVLHLLLVIFLFAIISFFHVWKISEIPKGFYVDELSIGYNALLIADTGRDEHKQFLPIFFKAFGEYKNPLYIYTLALIYKLFGVSEMGLRITSFIFFLLFLLGTYLLVTNIYRDNKMIPIYVILCGGFLPWFFTVSRISFEVISQLTIVTYSLLFIYRVYHSQLGREKWLNPISAGVFLGLSIYSYSTARLLSFLMLISLMGIYLRKDTYKKTSALCAAFFLMVVPYVVFSVNNPGALTARFKHISYVYDPSISLLQKILIFVGSYSSYFGFDFLLLKGDPNLRHATGYGGELFIPVFLLSIIGLICCMIRRDLFRDKFLLFMFINMLLSPVAASLTKAGLGPHALRSIMLGLFILFFSCYGLSFFFSIKNNLLKNILISVAFAVLVFQACFYLNDYFTRYRETSIGWFESYDFKNTLITAIERQPEVIVISPFSNQPYILLAFYNYFISNPRQVPIYVAKNMIPLTNTCVIYFKNDPLHKLYTTRFHDFSLHDSIARLGCN